MSLVIRAGTPVRFAAAVGAAVALSLPASVFARDWRGPIDAPRVAIQGGHAAGPASYDRLWVRKYGPKDPRCVMVAVPGSPAGQGGFGWIAHAIAARVPGLAVWAVDRRPNAFEDVSAFGSGTPNQALGYYLGGQPFDGKHFEPVQPDQAGFVRKWGASVALRDLRHVIRGARAGGRRCVIVAGHSFGGLMVPSYAAWDFNGRSKPDVLAGGSAAVSFTLVDGLGAVIEALGVRVAEQLRDIDLVRPPTSFLGGVSALLRKRIGTHEGIIFFIEGGLGVSDATAQVPEGGTRFNYLFQAGGGFSRRLGQRMALIGNVRLFHLSNNGLRGRHRNPDIEALGAHAGVLIGF